LRNFKNFGWKGTFKEFLTLEKNKIMNALSEQIYDQTLEEAKFNPLEKVRYHR